MGTAIRIEKNGRQLEVRALITAGDWQIWVFEKGARIYLYDVVPYEPGESTARIEGMLYRARQRIENDSVTLPLAQQSPRPTATP